MKYIHLPQIQSLFTRMSNKTIKKYNNKFQLQHFLVLSYEQQKQHKKQSPPKYRYNHGINGKSRGSNSCGICWILCSVLVQLLYATESVAQNVAAVAPLANNIPSADLVVTSSIDATEVVATVTAKTFTENNSRVNKRSHHSTFSDLDKEVVERLIKQWAPVVWLAPEEKFMPLGVEEFLAHVHPESKDNSFTPGMPFGDNSEKSFLVTNTEIDKLLENETSFIHGRNPNITPVPIYAVVTLCNQDKIHPAKHQQIEILPSVQSLPSIPSSFQTNYSPQLSKPVLQHGFMPTSLELTKPTRGPYIPVTLGPQNDGENTIRRSSRLYPMFHKAKRSLSNTPIPPSDSVPPYELVMGESMQNIHIDRRISNPTSTPIKSDVEESEKINNFIANLADNVKFSIPLNEQENVLEHENGQQINGLGNTPGTIVPSFHVTYWMFYPYSQGKNMCTLSLGPFGRIPFPAVYGYCLGRKKDIGSHIGDWEHMTLYFTGAAEPEAMYVSAHDAGAYYAYNRLTGSFEFKRQETRKGILQRPNFPKTVTTFNDHPVLFAAKGSHGLWTAPGKHRFVKVARLYDINGFGTPWNTWKHVEITYENIKSYGRALSPSWLSFKGKWGNPKSKCHPLRRIGLNFCEFSDGPTGIPLKEPHFQCGSTYRR
ncbi:Vacuolar protein sorting-associated protein 62 [Lucilia cuprina]|nr:Vacuolar protein sorting-associated protein 62 [Lucilia cuprina]